MSERAARAEQREVARAAEDRAAAAREEPADEPQEMLVQLQQQIQQMRQDMQEQQAIWMVAMKNLEQREEDRRNVNEDSAEADRTRSTGVENSRASSPRTETTRSIASQRPSQPSSAGDTNEVGDGGKALPAMKLKGCKADPETPEGTLLQQAFMKRAIDWDRAHRNRGTRQERLDAVLALIENGSMRAKADIWLAEHPNEGVAELAEAMTRKLQGVILEISAADRAAGKLLREGQKDDETLTIALPRIERNYADWIRLADTTAKQRRVAILNVVNQNTRDRLTTEYGIDKLIREEAAEELVIERTFGGLDQLKRREQQERVTARTAAVRATTDTAGVNIEALAAAVAIQMTQHDQTRNDRGHGAHDKPWFGTCRACKKRGLDSNHAPFDCSNAIPTATCRKCGAKGDHFTRRCPK